MQKFLDWFDELVNTNKDNKLAGWNDRIIFFFLLLMIIFSPHSIAATQTAWICGMVAWAVRFSFQPRPKFFKTPLNYAFLLFFLWSLISSIFSYAPDISLDKLRGVSLFLILIFVINNLPSKKTAYFLAFALIVSCMVNVSWTLIERTIGRGIEVIGVSQESPLAKNHYIQSPLEKIIDGDTLLGTGKRRIHTPEALVEEIEKQGVIKLKTYHNEFYYDTEVKKDDLLPGNTALEKLGISGWKKNHNWRAQGFYGHFTTYSEVLQLIAALAFGLLLASITDSKNKKVSVLLGIALAGIVSSLVLTVTRASQAAFIFSSFIATLLGGTRKIIISLLLVSIPVVLIGLYYLNYSRSVSFFDFTDNSITWRQTVYREGFNLFLSSPRHITVGVGMDSIKRFAVDWHLFDDGKLPMGHFHSTPLQLAVERGLPALLIWIWILWILGSSLVRKLNTGEIKNWREKGIILGSFGGLIGFTVSGLVHYNLGDGEVAMVFYILMGCGTYWASLPAALSTETS